MLNDKFVKREENTKGNQEEYESKQAKKVNNKVFRVFKNKEYAIKYNFQQTPPATQEAGGKQVRKGVRWMPWLLQAMKDVISCDKLWVDANNP